jgi:TPR repeat protein
MTPEPDTSSPDLVSARRWLDRHQRGNDEALSPGLRRVRERDAARIGQALTYQYLRQRMTQPFLVDASVEWLLAVEHTKDPHVAAEVGACLVDAQRSDEALALLRRSAEGGSAWGMLHYGRLLLGMHAEAADEWIERALEERPGYARVLLEDFQFRGMDATEARWRAIAADLGDQYSLLVTARRAGEHGDLEQLRHALQRVDDPEEIITTAAHLGSLDQPEAAILALTIAAEREHPRAQLELGRWLLKHDQPVEAEAWLRSPVEAELPGAALLLAASLNRQNRSVEAEEVLIKAAAGDAEAAYDLATAMLARGQRQAARQWFERAAQQGLTEAMVALASLADDMNAWMRWMGIAAARGHARAALRLGLFEHEQDHPCEARAWLGEALAREDPDAAQALAEVGASS